MRTDSNRLSTDEVLAFVEQAVQREFDSNHRILSLSQYLSLLSAAPKKHLRGSAQYFIDALDYYGKTDSGEFKIFSTPPHRVIGHAQVQEQLYRSLKSFSRQKTNNKLLLLHGPNGSAKTSLVRSLMAGAERYSHEKEGAIYSLNWIFPVESYTKGNIGIAAHENKAGNKKDKAKESRSKDSDSFAHIADEDMLARIPCDLNDHPIFLIPQEQRREFLQKLLGERITDEIWNSLPHYLTHGDLCHRCKQIFETLLNSHQGDLSKVLRHAQIERFFYSRRYRKGLISIEPQMHVDAQYHQLSYNKSLGALPPSLQSLNLFTVTGDLVEGNRGLIEYNDLLKRPLDAFKYLLGACENNTVSIGHSIAHLDTLWVGTSNELQLDAFKEFPDFISFKGRIELVCVPYLLEYKYETQIYENDFKQVSADKHVAPHSSWVLGLWAVLTRLKKPGSTHFDSKTALLLSSFSVLEKAKLYNAAEMPAPFTPDERKLIRSALKSIRNEFSDTAYYEGRLGASAREMKSILYSAANNPEYACLSPLSLIRELNEFVKHTSEYEFLRMEPQGQYHDVNGFTAVVQQEYLNQIDHEIRASIGLYDPQQWEDFLRRYISNVSHWIKKEKIKNPITGELDPPDQALMREFERIVDAPDDSKPPKEGTDNLDSFRKNVLSQMGAWSLDHPKEAIVYQTIFPEFWKKIEKHFFESQKVLLNKMYTALLEYGSEDGKKAPNLADEGTKLAYDTIENMKLNLGYCEQCAKEAISFLMKNKY